jgi:DNA-binding transcriptional ArsR family regulator
MLNTTWLYNVLVTNMPIDSLSLAFGALADPTRRAILARLAATGEATVATLAEPFDMSSPAISKHLKVLERAGLVAVGRNAQSRPRRLIAQPLAEATEWLAHYRPFWESTLDNLDDYVRELKAKRTAKVKSKSEGKAPAKIAGKPMKARPASRSKK